MFSVMHSARFPQRLAGFLTIISVLALLGCQPSAPTKKDAPDSSSAPNATEESAVPAQDLPGVDGPVKEMPGAESAEDVEPPAEPEEPDAVEPVIEETVIEETVKEEPAPAKDEPVKEEPAKEEPAKEPETEEAAASPKVGNEAPADDANAASLEPAVKWMPKPASDNADAEAADAKAMKPYTEKISADLTLDMVPVPGGTFKMGSPDDEADRNDDEGPQVEVKVEPFWMGKTEVTWNQFEPWGAALDKDQRKAKNVEATQWDKSADALANPTHAYSDMTFGMGKDGYPAICMTQFAAKMYCKWLSAKTGHYYRLPTEAEWEYACRAGTTDAYSFGKDAEHLDDFAWNTDNSDEKYHKVGEKKPNAWGLYDMHGNVAEWVLDEYDADRYKQWGEGPLENPLAIVTKSYPQVARGGAWTDEAPLLRSAARRASTKDWKMQDPQIPQSIWYFTDAPFVGFRVVRPLRTPTAEEAAKYEVTEFEKQEFLDYRKAQAGKQ